MCLGFFLVQMARALHLVVALFAVTGLAADLSDCDPLDLSICLSVS